jgi:CheY-like chemotaxis protein
MSKKRMSKRRNPGTRKTARGRGRTRAIETALAALAHDIRTPLTGILAHAELLAASELDDRARSWALSVKSAAEHLAQLTTIVCDAVRADAAGLVLRKDIFSPRQFAEDLGAALAARAQTSGLTSHVDIADGIPDRASGDSIRLRAALENLIDNAVKFTARGVVKLQAAAEPAARGKCRLVFTVSDSGIGMKPAELKRLFKPFSQASETVSRRYGGTGLGLTLVQRIARAMGGDLTVTSRPGKGSVFTLTALLTVTNGKPGRATSQPARRNGGHPPRKILCVEDSPYGRVVINTMLRELGHQADFVASGESALDVVKKGEHDLVLMDITLNGIDGIETTRRIRALPPPAGRVPVIGISARTEERDSANARAAGMDIYLTKPVSPRALVDAIEKTAR